MSCPVTIRIQEDDFDIAREIAGLTKGRTDIGAVVSFSGICRADEDSAKIAALTLEHDLRLMTRDRHFERIPQLYAANAPVGNRDNLSFISGVS